MQNQVHLHYKKQPRRRVKIEGCEYRLEENQIINWLSYFGEEKSQILEDKHEVSDDSSDDLQPVGNGIYSLLMKLTWAMPQLVPMHGKRIWLYLVESSKDAQTVLEPTRERIAKKKRSLG
jgi:hypothetical protein